MRYCTMGHGSGLTTLSRDHAAFSKCAVKELEVRFLEKTLRGTLRVGRVGDNNIEAVFVVLQELEAVADMHLHLGVLKADAHAGQIFLAEPDHSLVNIAERRLLNTVVLDHFPQHTTIAPANHEHFLRIGVREHAQMCDHLLVAELIPLRALNDVVQDQDHPVIAGFEDEDILVLALLVVHDLIDLKCHGLARPHVTDLAEPAIFDGGMCDLCHCA